MSDIGEPIPKIPKMEDQKESKEELGFISLEVGSQGFKAPPIHEDTHEIEELTAFLVEKGTLVTKLCYTDEGFDSIKKKREQYRQEILKHCPNISEVKFHFTEYPDESDDANSQLLVKFLTALAPGLVRLETDNNVIGLHYLSCMGYIYENFSRKIKFVKTDELKPEELSVLGGDNNNDNCAMSLEELIFKDNDFLYSKRVHQSAESLALKPGSLADLVKLKNLKRIDLPFLINKDKVPEPIDPLPLLTYASIRLLRVRRGIKPSPSPFVKNIGICVANVAELKLSGIDTGLMVLSSILKSCEKLDTLDITELNIPEDYNIGFADVESAKLKFKRLVAEVKRYTPENLQLILYFIDNVKSLTNINISRIEEEETVDKLIAASGTLAGVAQHEIQLNLKWSRSSSKNCEEDIKIKKESPVENLKIIITR